MAHIRIYLNDVLMDQFELGEGKVSIGRDAGCDIVIDNAGVSSVHAFIEKEGGSYVISDNNSTNGVFVNGDRIQRHTLKYWDEIQLYNYVLKFMAVAGLQEETADPDIAQDGGQDQSGTMEISIAGVQDLLKLREKKKEAYIELQEPVAGQSRYIIQGTKFSIGRSKDADLVTGEWFFAPAVAAEIQRRADGYYLVPHKRGKARVDGESINQATRLQDGDSLQVRKLQMTFYHRLLTDR